MRNGHPISTTDPASAVGNVESTCLAASLPTELIQLIYQYLGPLDFHSARSTSRAWMDASIQLQLLSLQLKRGGWWATLTTGPSFCGDALAMSRCLSAECSLAASWDPPRVRQLTQRLCTGTHQSQPYIKGDEWSKYEPRTPSKVEAFVSATSLCGTYFVRAIGRQICAYRIRKDTIYRIGELSCESCVLAVTIDASMERVAVAAVLEGRSGLYIDLLASDKSYYDSSPWETSGSVISTSLTTGSILELQATDGAGNAILPSCTARHSGPSPGFDNPNFIGTWPETINMYDALKYSVTDTSLHPMIVYRHICTTKDPPFSVAIGPRSQCVAFGCTNGVELYWIDQATGENLNRWFRLSHPSEHLFFLPPRRFQDYASRLRLISTARHKFPGYTGGIFGVSTATAGSTWLSLRTSWLPVAAEESGLFTSPDHSHAVPLKDGHHILFIDNQSGMLCIGTDQPAGLSERFSRKIILEPPTSTPPCVPTFYAATGDIDNGLKVVASYMDHIVLFSVPPDVLRYSTAEQEQTLPENHPVTLDEEDFVEVLAHPTSNARFVGTMDMTRSVTLLNMSWIHYLRTACRQSRSCDSIWPLHISGLPIGSFWRVECLAIHKTTTLGVTIWAFSGARDEARSWSLDGFYQ